MSLKRDIENAINRASAENPSGTPDFILAEFLTDCLAAFDKATIYRATWRGQPAEFNPTVTPTSTGRGFCGECSRENKALTHLQKKAAK